MSILNDTNEKFECNTKNKTILSLYLSFIHLHLDSSEVAVKFQNIDIQYNFLEAKNIIFKELIDNYSYNYIALVMVNREDSPFLNSEQFCLENLKIFYEVIKLVKNSSYKEMNQICRKVRQNILCFESTLLSEIIKQSYNLKKGNLFKFLILEFIIQAVYFCDFLFMQNKSHELKILNEISMDVFKEVEFFLKKFDYKINYINSKYTDLTKKCINERKKSVVDGRKIRSLNIIKCGKISNNDSNTHQVFNEINEMYKYNKKYPEVVKLFKKNLCDRKIIRSKDYLDEIIIKTIDQTKNLYWNNNKENITPFELRKILEHWIATEFKGFCEKKGIKFHNMILVFIQQCNAKL